MKFKLANKNYILVLLAIVVVVLGVFNISTLKNKSADRTAPTSTVTPIPIDNVNDGVYTNYEYGFRFEYPKDKFEQIYSDGEGASWQLRQDMNQENTSVSIMLIVRNWENYRGLYEFLYAEGGQSSIGKETVNLIESKRFKDYMVLKTLSKTNPDVQTEHAVSYDFVWLKENKPVIALSLLSSVENESLVNSNKVLLEQIANSFEFTD